MNPKKRLDYALSQFRMAKLPDDPATLRKALMAYVAQRRVSDPKKITRNAIAAFLRHTYTNYDDLIEIAGFTQDELDIIKAVTSDRVMVRFDKWKKAKPYVR